MNSDDDNKWSSGSDNDGDGDGDDDGDDDGPDLQPERDAINRVGPGGMLGIGPQTRIERAMMEPLERFRLHVDATSRHLNNWGADISEQNIEKMLFTSAKLENVGHKNATAYVLGFLATGGGKKLRKDYFNNVINKILPNTEEGSVLPPDVLRYARLWEELE